MKIEYFDRINAKANIEVKVNAKTGHFLKNEKNKHKTLTNEEYNALSKKKKEEYNQLKFERSMVSLNEMEEKGFEICDSMTVEESITLKEYEVKYLESREYREFRTSLKKEIRNVFDEMSAQEKKVMYLRFFKNYSISQIASALGIKRGTAQDYIARGCKHINYFLDKDIKEQDKLERMRKMKREQKKIFKNW